MIDFIEDETPFILDKRQIVVSIVLKKKTIIHYLLIMFENWQRELKSITKTFITVGIGQSRNKNLITLMLMVGNEPFHLHFQKLVIQCFLKTLKPYFIAYLLEEQHQGYL